ncbi:dTDP-4-amino-4,6-dideoxygalactose transaminase [Gracilibacillus halotolerans]|uniref:dTDP-4-amino-4,6-dideoxygalactose transaminase n=1 Tax=Gracilibacillus halotolerans TaxID=74386 RepID=A0A841RPA5_9BACI|nr:DegT/DnrJ/EryC1/StrS family aminotransferase [Gracilibacillus halotolerans]MBB6513702.1 dTDP-4-amino-4,6-dideoxygalactose transaminase [Gracilibacillus halotolerans]
MIPISDPKSQFETIIDSIVTNLKDVILSGKYILGPNVKKLEEKIADRLGVTDAVAVANGTDALILTLAAFGIKEGDEVITTPFSFFATAEAITRVGATPVFADVNEETFNIEPTEIEKKISRRTTAIIPVHLFGQPAMMDEINAIAKKYDLYVIEDACQAFGATYKSQPVGSLGDAACFSFFPTKNFSTMGDGGIVTTSNQKLAEKIRKLRVHGSQTKYHHDEIGYNSRLDEIHAAILLTSLPYLDEWNRSRITLANRYKNKLNHLDFIKLPSMHNDGSHVFHLFSLATDYRTEIIKHLQAEGIQTGVYYPRCIHLQNAYRNLDYKEGDFPIAEALSKKLFSIPLYPGLTIQDQDKVITALKHFKVNNND